MNSRLPIGGNMLYRGNSKSNMPDIPLMDNGSRTIPLTGGWTTVFIYICAALALSYNRFLGLDRVVDRHLSSGHSNLDYVRSRMCHSGLSTDSELPYFTLLSLGRNAWS